MQFICAFLDIKKMLLTSVQKNADDTRTQGVFEVIYVFLDILR